MGSLLPYRSENDCPEDQVAGYDSFTEEWGCYTPPELPPIVIGGGDGGDDGDGGSGDDPPPPPDDDPWGDDDGGGGTPTEPPPPEYEDEEPINLALSCPTSIQRGSTGTCTATVTPSSATLSWTFTPSDPVWPSNAKTGGTTWGGNWAISGTVEVRASVGAQIPAVASKSVSVTPRQWSWTNLNSQGQASAGQYDQCMSPGEAGVVVGTSCSASDKTALFTPPTSNSGFSLRASTGPNPAVWFVGYISTAMHIRSQIAKKYRADGTTHPVTGVAAVVAGCATALNLSPARPSRRRTSTRSIRCAHRRLAFRTW